MVAVIKVGHSMHRIFNYNENKVKEGVAECIGAENYPLNADEMSLKIKLNFLLKRMEMNENVKRNSIHISLNFDPSETGLPKEKLMQISNIYMQKLGFGDQPFLVYQHHDAGHPHLHLVTTNIRADGSRIDLHHLGIRKSEPARKEIEKIFGLVVANKQQKEQVFRLKPVNVRKVRYGRTETKRAITNVLESILDKYRYASLPELNAVLHQYNIRADRGGKTSRIYLNNGLVYRVLEEQGNPVGVPIKASDFYNKPTLKFLEKKYEENKIKRISHKKRIKNIIDMALLRKKDFSIRELMKALEKEGIHTVLRQNKEGLIYGITYVDHQTKCVFNGSALGKRYSAKAIQERCESKKVFEPNSLTHSAQKRTIGLQPQAGAAAETRTDCNDLKITVISKETEKVWDALTRPEYTSDYLPYQLKKKRKKKRKKKLNNDR